MTEKRSPCNTWPSPIAEHRRDQGDQRGGRGRQVLEHIEVASEANQ